MHRTSFSPWGAFIRRWGCRGCAGEEPSSVVPGGQRFFEGFEAAQALRRGDVTLRCLVPGSPAQLATRADSARAVAAAMVTLAAGLNKAA